MIRKIVRLILIAISASIIITAIYAVTPQRDIRAKIDNSINRGLLAIKENQSPHGEIPMQFCRQESGKEICGKDRTPLFTSYTLLALSNLKNEPLVKEISKSGINFLKSEMTNNKMWKYVNRPNWSELRPDIINQLDGGVLADFDSTALASMVLEIYDEAPDNKELFRERRGDEGLIYIWDKNIDNTQNQEIDCGAVINSLSYLKDSSDATSCEYINQQIRNDLSCSMYYENGVVLDYFIGYAKTRTESCLADSVPVVTSRILNRQKPDGSFGSDMETALSISTLLRLSLDQPNLKDGVEWLINQQQSSGLWSKQPVFFFTENEDRVFNFGSQELTTALAIEAIDLYRQQNALSNQ